MDKHTGVDTHLYQVNKATLEVQGYAILQGRFFIIQLLDENWVQEVRSGTSVMVLYLWGEDDIGCYAFRILLSGVPLSYLPFTLLASGLYFATPANKVAVLVALAVGNKKTTPVKWPTTPDEHAGMGVTTVICDPRLIQRLQTTKGKITHLWQKVELKEPVEQYIKSMIGELLKEEKEEV